MDRSKLQGAARQASGLGAEISKANTAAQAQAEQYKNLAKQFATETEQQLQSGVSGIDSRVQAELDTAKALEDQRLANIQAIKDFAAGRKARTSDLTPDEIAQGFVKDAQGRVVNKYGEMQYDTNVRGGAKTREEELDYLSGLLRTQGADQGEVNKLLGVSGNKEELAKLDANYQKALEKDYINRMAQTLDTSWWQEFANGGNKYGQLYREIFGNNSNAVRNMSKDQLQNYIKDKIRSEYVMDNRNTFGDQITLNKRDAGGEFDLLGNIYKSNEIQDAPDEVKQLYQAEYDKQLNTALNSIMGIADRGDLAGINQYRAAQNASKGRELYDPRGVLGQAVFAGKADQTYNALANTLANSQAAQNLTKQGVASEPLRTSYSALEKLLGKQDSELTLSKDAPKYEAGKYLINPDLIRKTF